MTDRPRILVLTTGGTILQREVAGKMQANLPLDALSAGLDGDATLEFQEISRFSGAKMTFAILLQMRDAIREARAADLAGVIITTGTDSLEEMAFALDLLLPPDGPVVFTGAMKPASALGYDGTANLQHAVQVVLSEPAASLGVLVAISGVVHPARYIRKQDSTMLDAFQSHPGPVADIRRGRPHYYYTALPDWPRYCDPNPARLAKLKVGLWTMALQLTVPEASLTELAGLVVAGMGTGSLSPEVLDALSPTWTARIPIVLTTRCATGANYDDYIYKGSLEKYEARGFRLQDYEGLNPLQARLKLVLQLASER